MNTTPSILCSQPATGRWLHTIVTTTLLVLVFASRPAHAVIATNGLVFDSMPAMFGLPWISNMEYQAHLQEMPGRPFLCASDEEPSLSLTNGGQHLNHQNHASILSEPKPTKDGIPVALLVSRGACSFEEKAREAMKLANVDFIIIHDDRSRTQLVPMSASDTSEISNHLLFVSHETGLQLRQMLRDHSNNSSANAGLIIAMDGQIPNGAYEPGYDDTEQWVMAAMSGFFAFVACIGCLLVCVQAGLLPAADVSMFGGEQLMTEDQVLKLPSVNYELRDEPAHQTSCAICIEEYEEGDKLRELPCGHVFHTECIVPWLTERHTSCPLCKSEVLPTDDNNSLWSNQWLTSYGPLLRGILPWRYGRVLVPGDDHNESNPAAVNRVVLQVEPTRAQGDESDPAVV